jgi:DNA-binding response OmpR family regulator
VPERIVVMLDDTDVARFVELNLRSAGYEVEVVSNREGLQQATHSRPDAIVLAEDLAGNSGIELALSLRSDPRLTPCVLIMLGVPEGQGGSSNVLALMSGVDDYIRLPFDPVEFLARMKAKLRRSRELLAGGRDIDPETSV